MERTWQKSKTASATFSIASIKGSETSSTFQKSWNATFKERSALPWLYCRDRASSPCGWPLCLPHTWTSSQWSGARRTLSACLSVSVDGSYFMRSFSSDMNSFLLLYASAKLATFLKKIEMGCRRSWLWSCCLSFSPSFWSGFKALSLAWTRERIGFLKVAITRHLQSVSEPSKTFSGCVVHSHYSVHASRVHHCEPEILEFRLPCCCC